MSVDRHSSSDSVEQDKSSSENVTIIAETFSDTAGATISSMKSENSTEQLICKSPQKKNKKKQEGHITLERREKEPQKSVESLVSEVTAHDGDNQGKPKLVILLGFGQLLIGIAIVVFGALVIVHNSALSRVGAGLWSGCIAVVTGVVGVLAGINDCYGLHGPREGRSNPFLTAFLALSLATLAAGNMAAVLAGTGIYRDTHRNAMPQEIDGDFEDEKQAWTPVLVNIGLLLLTSTSCILAIASIYYASKRVCSCLRPKEPYNHNQFDPNFKTPPTPYVIQISEKQREKPKANKKANDLCKNLESKLSGSENETLDKPKTKEVMKKVQRIEEGNAQFGSANSKDKLVNNWLGKHHQPPVQKIPKTKTGVRKMKVKPQPIMLVPAHPTSTLGRGVPVSVMMAPGARYATLPVPPHPAHYPPAMYYPRLDPMGGRRRRPSRRGEERTGGAPAGAGGAGGAGRGGRRQRTRNSPLTRSLERIHRKKDTTEPDLTRTYTGLDRTIAEQFIAVCDESRNQPQEKTDSSGFDTASSECHSNRF